jgi:hypothetical protein
MGMDVCGNDPTSEQGRYFGNNVWWWHPLAAYACKVAPEITSACEHWHTNDGDGLDNQGALALADALQKEISASRTDAYARRYASEQEMTPDEPCSICAGTGTRGPSPHSGAGVLKLGGLKCNGCGGSGHIRPWSTQYPFSVENVVKFVAFLRESGGFRIL